jgi:hypothetical protein
VIEYIKFWLARNIADVLHTLFWIVAIVGLLALAIVVVAVIQLIHERYFK